MNCKLFNANCNMLIKYYLSLFKTIYPRQNLHKWDNLLLENGYHIDPPVYPANPQYPVIEGIKDYIEVPLLPPRVSIEGLIYPLNSCSFENL